MKTIITIVLYILTYVKSGYLSVNIQRNVKQNTVHKGLQFLELYESQEKELHPVENIQKLSQVSIVPILNYFDIQYYGYIFLGSNYQPMSVIFDTGSNILWVESKNCTQCRNFTNKYDSEQSITFTNTSISKNITYAIGFVDGTIVQDKVWINKQIGVNMNFMTIHYEDKLAGTVADGVMGLGIDKEGDYKNSLIYSLYEDNLISSPSFSFYLTESKKESRLYIGDITENQYLRNTFDNIKYVNINNGSRYWESSLESITTFNRNNKTSANYTFQTSSKVIFDTGTSYLIIPAFDIIDLIPAITSKAVDNKCALTPYMQIVCKCISPQNFDDIELTINGQTFIIRTDDIIEFYPTLEYQCRFEIIVDMFMLDGWILGDSVLRYTLLTFDMDKKRVGYIQAMDKLNDSEVLGRVSNKSNGYSVMDILIWIAAVLILLTTGYFIYKHFFSANEEPEYKQLIR